MIQKTKKNITDSQVLKIDEYIMYTYDKILID